ncbi:MAG TPA: stage II sporulation protein M, partial [Pseudonocardia sp.]|nr:stage II sporulation protein M [Pseudonocardia sp.]
AYILLVLGGYLLGRSWLRPATVGAQNRRQGYARGLRQLGWLSLPALALFVIGALYEAFTLRYLVPPLVQALS